MQETQERPGFDPWVGKIPWRREWQPTPVFLPGEFHGQRSLVGYSPWGNKKLDTTEHTHIYLLCVEAGQFKDYINTAQIPFSVSQQVYTPWCCCCSKSLQSSPTLWDTMDCSPLDSSVHGILQAKILEWVAIPSSRGSFQHRVLTKVNLSVFHRSFSLWGAPVAQW